MPPSAVANSTRAAGIGTWQQLAAAVACDRHAAERRREQHQSGWDRHLGAGGETVPVDIPVWAGRAGHAEEVIACRQIEIAEGEANAGGIREGPERRGGI